MKTFFYQIQFSVQFSIMLKWLLCFISIQRLFNQNKIKIRK